MNSRDDGLTETSDRRNSRRHSIQSRVRLTVETRELEGVSENVSKTGVLFFSEGEIRVTVELEEDGVVRSVPGRLVRAVRMRDDNIGWAIAFDRD